MTDVLGYHHVSLSVTDLERSTEWYQQVLGLEVSAQVEGEGFRRNRLRAAGGGVTLTLTAHRDESGETFSERRPGLDHVAFNVGGVPEVEALKRRFEELGVVHSAVKSTTTGSALITLRDPDNIQIEVFGGPVTSSIGAGGSGA